MNCAILLKFKNIFKTIFTYWPATCRWTLQLRRSAGQYLGEYYNYVKVHSSSMIMYIKITQNIDIYILTTSLILWSVKTYKVCLLSGNNRSHKIIQILKNYSSAATNHPIIWLFLGCIPTWGRDFCDNSWNSGDIDCNLVYIEDNSGPTGRVVKSSFGPQP